MLKINLEYEVEETKDKYKIIKIHKDKKYIYVGSKYNMNREIQRFLQKVENSKCERDVFLVYGFGTGSHIIELRKKYKNRIIVFEPNERIYMHASNSDIVKDDDRLDVICCEKDELLAIVSKYINEFNFKSSEIISFANYKQLYYEESLEFFSIINKFIIALSLEVNTKRHFGKTWFNNCINSIPYVIKAVAADLYENTYKNTMAIIVSAGPSIEKNVDLLKGYNGALIVSGGRTLPMLLDKGISPNLLVVADTGKRNYELVKDYIEKVDVPLLFSEASNLDIVKHHKAKKIFYTFNDLILKILGRKMKPISTGGSVAHVMTSYAAMLGCNPIVFIGQDLAYTGEKIHAKSTENRDGSCKYKEMIRDDDIYIKDINGNTVRTSLVLNNYREKLEKIITLYPNVEFINATEGGAKIAGTVEMKLEDVLKVKGNETINIVKSKSEYTQSEMKRRAIKQLNISKQQANNFKNELLEMLHQMSNKSLQQVITNNLIIIEKFTNSIFNEYMYETIYNLSNINSNSNNFREDIEKLYLRSIDELKEVLGTIDNQINKLQ